MNKKILIATGIYPPDIGGPATILKSLISSLEKKNFDIKLITYSGSNKESDDSNNIFRINRNKFLNQIKYFLAMYKLAKWADVVYVTDTYSVGYFAYLIKKLTGKRYLVRFVGDSAWETAVGNNWTTDYIIDFQKKKYNSKIERLKSRRQKILLNADKVITVSNFITSVAKLIGVKNENIKLIYNSIDFVDEGSAVEVEKIRKEFGDAKIISTACRLTSWKGVDGIIKTIKNLKEKVGDVAFIVLGDGPEMNSLKQLARDEGVDGQVRFLGRVDHNRIVNYFKASDLFILNTNYEGLSHTLLEVMKAKAPIIATTSGGNPEVIEDNKNGLLVSYNNTDELLLASIKILTDNELTNKFVENSSEKLKYFDWDNVISETSKVLSDL
jgi:glycosyltransferase involved in cell wall biosynthesis